MKRKNKKTRNTLVIIGFIVAVILVGYFASRPLAVGFNENYRAFEDTDTLKYQYAGEYPFENSDCGKLDDYLKDNGIYESDFSKDKIIPTKKSQFKVVMSNVRVQLNERAEPTAKVRYDAKVYRNGLLIDEIKGIYSQHQGTCAAGFRDQVFYRAYSDSGEKYIPEGDEITPIYYPEDPLTRGCTIDNSDGRYTNFNYMKKIELPEGETGINVIFGYGLWFYSGCGTSGRGSVLNRFEIVDEPVELINDTIEEERIDTYRLENNQCSKINILSSEKTENDYDALSECQSKIVSNGGDVEEPLEKDCGIFCRFNNWITKILKRLFGLDS